MANQQAKPSLPGILNGRELDYDISSLKRMQRCNKDIERLIAGANREIATSYALLAEIDRLFANRQVAGETTPSTN